jgi:hypothetical protein
MPLRPTLESDRLSPHDREFRLPPEVRPLSEARIAVRDHYRRKGLHLSAIPSRRHSAAIDSSPRNPSSTMRIFSSAPYCFRVIRRMSLMTFSEEGFVTSIFCLIVFPLKDTMTQKTSSLN